MGVMLSIGDSNIQSNPIQYSSSLRNLSTRSRVHSGSANCKCQCAIYFAYDAVSHVARRGHSRGSRSTQMPRAERRGDGLGLSCDDAAPDAEPATAHAPFLQLDERLVRPPGIVAGRRRHPAALHWAEARQAKAAAAVVAGRRVVPSEVVDGGVAGERVDGRGL